jgi:hypothetical protein
MVVAERHSTNGKGLPVHSRLLHDDDGQYYVEVHSPGLHQIVKVSDEVALQRWIARFEQ